jgi:hypothetical protein
MQPIVFYVRMFDGSSKQEMKDSRDKLLVLLKALVNTNQIYLRSHPDTPDLYDTDITYQPEFDTEEWQDIPTTLERHFGDCEDLAAFRCAELREKFGVKADPFIRWRKIGKSYRFHALVKWPDKIVNGKLVKGRIEDPSRRMGMRKWSGYLSNTSTSQQF